MSGAPDIRYLFEPRGVAIFGVSSNEKKIGYKVLSNIVSSGYKGRVYGINPKGGEALGITFNKSIDEVDGPIDLATIVIPANLVHDAVEDCAKKGVKFLSIITSGFSEIGNISEEKRILETARESGMRVLGPNIFGVYSAKSSMNATFGPRDIKKGSVAIVTQSGALGIAMIGKTAVERIGLSSIVSVGNKSDIDESDLLEYLVENEETRIIMMYIEGISKGERLVHVLKEATRRKPIIVIKSGRSKRGAMAAASHTGSLAGADDIFDAIMRQCGVLRAESLEEAFDWCKFLASNPMPRGGSTVIVTNGGGIGVMATDACEKYGIELFDDQETLKNIFSPVTPKFGSTKNPVDITGQATSSNYRLALGAALENPDIDAVISLYCETAVFDAENLLDMVREVNGSYRRGGKPIVFSMVGGEKVDDCFDQLKGEGIPVFDEVYGAVQCLGVMYRYNRLIKEERTAPPEVDIDLDEIERIIAGARADGRSFLLAHEGQGIMRAASIPVPESRLARNLDEAVRAAEGIGYPVVMKVVSKDIIHKSDAGGVALDLDDEAEVIDAYQVIMQSCRRYNPDAVIKGVEVAEMVKRGVETIVGARHDGAFGPIVMFGLGGIYVEVMKDVSFRAAPLTRDEALGMVKEIRSYPLLLGVRGEKRKDIQAVVDSILKLSALMHGCKEISDIEINPLVAYKQGRGVKAVDVRVLLTRGTKR